MNDKHEFAIYTSQNLLLSSSELIVDDKELLRRLSSVLRLQVGDRFTLFNRTHHAQVRILAQNKGQIRLQVHNLWENQVLHPKITCLLPLLKRDDLEQSLYSAVELGANQVQLVLTEKVQRSWGGAKELERLERVMIAAAEQSKHFALPSLLEPENLSLCLEITKKSPQTPFLLFFDPTGEPATTWIPQVQRVKGPLFLLIGPEGDLTSSEKAQVRAAGFQSAALTPTVLRACQAFTLGLGILRSILR